MRLYFRFFYFNTLKDITWTIFRFVHGIWWYVFIYYSRNFIVHGEFWFTVQSSLSSHCTELFE